MSSVVLIAHNLRSAHNVGSLLRTAEGLGVDTVWLTGYSPYPQRENDYRLPHLVRKMNTQIAKTALGAETMQPWQYQADIISLLAGLKKDGYLLVALEQATDAVALAEFPAPIRLALIVGREVDGIEPEVLALCDKIVEIPMAGQKESFNVVQAAAMALYQFRFKI